MSFKVTQYVSTQRLLIAQAEKMVNDDNVMAIMGPNCSGNTGAVITNVLVPNGIVSISPSATSPALNYS